MNEEDLMKELQQYFFQNRDTINRQLPNGGSAYDPNQAKVWTDSYSLQDLYRSAMDKGLYSEKKMQTMPNNYQDQTDMTLRRLMEQQQKRIKM